MAEVVRPPFGSMRISEVITLTRKRVEAIGGAVLGVVEGIMSYGEPRPAAKATIGGDWVPPQLDTDTPPESGVSEPHPTELV